MKDEKVVITEGEGFIGSHKDDVAAISKAKEKLGWTPKTSFEDLVRKMVRNDLKKYHQE